MATKHIIINFIGGPGVGKTTLASQTFAKLKSQGQSAEFVSEYIKQLIYLGEYEKIADQEYVSQYQYNLLKGAYKKLEFIVTDAPLLHGIIYNKFHNKNDEKHQKLNEQIRKWTSEFNNVFIVVERNPEIQYKENEGRIHTEEEAKNIDNLIFGELKNVEFLRITPENKDFNQKVLDKIFDFILKQKK